MLQNISIELDSNTRSYVRTRASKHIIHIDNVWLETLCVCVCVWVCMVEVMLQERFTRLFVQAANKRSFASITIGNFW